MPVLIVDDDADIRRSVAKVLHDEGYETVAAANGREAIDWIRSSELEPCVVLLDLMMPVMDGWQFLEHLARDRKLSPIPVVIMSAYPSVRQIHERLFGDSELFLPKPVKLNRLLSVVAQFCTGGDC